MHVKILTFAGLASILWAGQSGYEFRFGFWPRDLERWQEDKRALELSPHPCGETVQARLSRMPDSADAYLVSESVVEIYADGNQMGVWSVPVDVIPIGVDGKRLLVAHVGAERAEFYWFGQDRSIIQAEAPDTARSWYSGFLECPGKSADSAYERCKKYPDLKTGKGRLLRFLVPCT